MADLSDKLFAILEKIYWADTRSRMAIALAEALPDLEAIDVENFEARKDRKTFRYIREIAGEYADLESDYSSDVRNEVRDALSMFLDLYRRYSTT